MVCFHVLPRPTASFFYGLRIHANNNPYKSSWPPRFFSPEHYSPQPHPWNTKVQVNYIAQWNVIDWWKHLGYWITLEKTKKLQWTEPNMDQGPGGESEQTTQSEKLLRIKESIWWSDEENREQKDLETGNFSVHPSTCSTSGSSSFGGTNTIIYFSFLQAKVWIVWYLWWSWSFTVNVSLRPWQ